jgi:cytochrome b561
MNYGIIDMLLMVCGFSILYYGSVLARLSEKPWFWFGFGFINILTLTNDIEKLSTRIEHLRDWKLKCGYVFIKTEPWFWFGLELWFQFYHLFFSLAFR